MHCPIINCSTVAHSCHPAAIAQPAQVGALVAGVVFGLVSDRTKFYVSALCGLAGAVVTLLLVPDISGLDLVEGVSPPSRCCCCIALFYTKGPEVCQHLRHRSAVGSQHAEGAHGCCATGDRRWMMVLEGQSKDYHGEAVNPANLSLFELALGYHKVQREWWHQQ